MMTRMQPLADKPAYVGLLAALTGSIALLGVYLTTVVLDIQFDPVIVAGVLAATAAVFAALAIAISELHTSTDDDS